MEPVRVRRVLPVAFGPVCAADLTAGTRGLVDEGTRGARPPELDRGRGRGEKGGERGRTVGDRGEGKRKHEEKIKKDRERGIVMGGRMR